MPEGQEYPLKIASNLNNVPSDGNNFVLYRTKVKRIEPETQKELPEKPVIIKELIEDSFTWENYPGNNLAERADKIKKLFSIVKEYLGDAVVHTDVLIAKGHEGKASIQLVQEEVDGRGLKITDPEWKEFHEGQAIDLQKKLDEALKDKRLDGLDLQSAKDWIRMDAINAPKNVMLTRDGKYKLIDVL